MAASKAARGAFILFEGVDRCGKTTQSTLLVETLKRACARPGWARPSSRDANGAAREARAGVVTREGATRVVLAVDREREGTRGGL